MTKHHRKPTFVTFWVIRGLNHSKSEAIETNYGKYDQDLEIADD